jgi:hypothetical protein
MPSSALKKEDHEMTDFSLPMLTHGILQVRVRMGAVHPQSNRSSRRDAQVHERRISPAVAEHVKGHEEKCANHVDVWILQHAGKGTLLCLSKIRWPDLLRFEGGLALSANGYDEVDGGMLARVEGLSLVSFGFHEKIFNFCWPKDVQ